MRGFIAWYTVRYFAIIALPLVEFVYRKYFGIAWRAEKLAARLHWYWLADSIPSELEDTEVGGKFLRWLCGWNGHSDIFWFNPGEFEPDMHCKRCGEDIG